MSTTAATVWQRQRASSHIPGMQSHEVAAYDAFDEPAKMLCAVRLMSTPGLAAKPLQTQPPAVAHPQPAAPPISAAPQAWAACDACPACAAAGALA